MLNIIAIIFVFSLLVIIHELGHFFAAKWMGVRVEKFSIGFPPTVYRKKIGETEFCISAIPLGGYVKMAGFIDESLDSEITGADDEFNSKPVWRRIVIIVAGVIMNLILAIGILTFLNYSQGERIIPITTVGIVGENGVAEKVGFEKDDKIIKIDNAAVMTWNDVQSNFVDHLNQDFSFTIIRDEKEMQLWYKKEWFKDRKGEQLDIAPLFTAKVGDVSSSMPAGELGLKTGDQILEVNGEAVNDWMEMTEAIRAHPDEEINIKWQRNSEIHEGKLTPDAYEEKNEQGETEKVGKIGIGYYYEHKDIGLAKAVINGFENTYDLIVLNMRGFWWWISGTKSASEILGGPITIAKMAGDAAQAGWTQLWYLIAALSAILAIFNILPIPALDGGHLFFLIIEGIMGRPISTKVKIKVQQIGMAVLLTFIVFILYVDLKRLLF